MSRGRGPSTEHDECRLWCGRTARDEPVDVRSTSALSTCAGQADEDEFMSDREIGDGRQSQPKADAPPQPRSLVAMTNWRSKACLLSEVRSQEFRDWAHGCGAYLYLVLVGPRSEISDLVRDRECWKVFTRFHDGTAMKPRTLRVPFSRLPVGTTRLIEGRVEWEDPSGEEQRANAVEIARWLLEDARRTDRRLAYWEYHTMQKFFAYRVEYVGKSYGDHGERTAAERVASGHEHVQQILAETIDYYPNAAVALIAMDAQIHGREAALSIGPDNAGELGQYIARFMAEPDGPLVDRSKLVAAAEAMLIRSFPEARNKQYKEFPMKDAPTLVDELLGAGISHLGVQIDVSQSVALIKDPSHGDRATDFLRFAVNLRTGGPDALPTDAPFSWSLG